MTTALLLTIFATMPALAEPVCEHCDCIELNHFYDDDGRKVFDQVIFWDGTERGDRVRGWRLWKTGVQTPRRDWARGGYAAVWFDGGVLREVRAADYRETWTQHDVEVVDREYLPQQQRRELRKP